jgi:HlyD family secretion protein
MYNAFKKKKYVYLGVAAFLIIGGYYWYAKSGSSSVEVSYETEQAQKGMLTKSISASGNVSVDQLANIDPTISGTVANLAVKVGDNVKEGQTLFTIINDDLTVSSAKASASLQQAKNSVDSAAVSEQQAKAEYYAAKKKDKNDSDSYTTRQLEVLKEKIDIAKDGIISAQKSYDATAADYRNQIAEAGKRTVKASMPGTVNAVNIKNGDDLSKLSSGSSRTVPIIIGDLGTLKAEVQVNEVDISDVEIGQKVMLTFSAIDELEVSGKVEKIDALGTVSSGVVTYNVTIGFDTLDERIKPEMSVSASIITDVKQDIIIVPNSAVKSQGNASYVEVLVGNTVQQKTVTTGISNDSEIEIISGVSVGNNVITQTIDSSSTSTATSSSKSSSRSGGFPGLGGLH